MKKFHKSAVFSKKRDEKGIGIGIEEQGISQSVMNQNLETVLKPLMRLVGKYIFN